MSYFTLYIEEYFKLMYNDGNYFIPRRENMQRTVYAYDLKFNASKNSKAKKVKSYEEDLGSILSAVKGRAKGKKSMDFKDSKKILYLDDYAYDSSKCLFKLIFISAKYATRRKVINTITFADRGILKEKPDGDVEKNHVLIRFNENNRAVALYESNRDGISFPKIMAYIEEYIEKAHKKKHEVVLYKIRHENIVSRDFLKALEKVKRIKAVTLTVDQEEVGVSDYKRFSGRNDISNDVDIVLKPAAKGASIFGDTVQEFYNMYKNQSMPIKRITIDGDRENKNPLTFDTEKMKEKNTINVQEEFITGEADTKDMFAQLEDLLKYY
jgi:hypothetical protein